MDGVMACLYALWLVGGSLDFWFHRRTDLPHTSGLVESALHGVQLVLVGGGVFAWLAFHNTRAMVALLSVITAAHAVAGYMDTVSADGRRRISPAEQHVHSILDVAPWLFLAWVTWRASPEWELRWDPAPAAVWGGLVIPALVLVVVPWAHEMLGCLRAGQRPRA